MIPDNEDRDDNKMYFFFTEKALEAENSAHTIYTRVGRLCVVRMASLCSYTCLLHTVHQAFYIQFYTCFIAHFQGQYSYNILWSYWCLLPQLLFRPHPFSPHPTQCSLAGFYFTYFEVFCRLSQLDIYKTKLPVLCPSLN